PHGDSVMKSLLVPAVCMLFVSTTRAAPADGLHEYGPARGTLILIGGGSMEGTGILEAFLRLAGGKDVRLVVVPTAEGNKNKDGSVRGYNEVDVVAFWKKRGIKHVRMVHTHDPKVADTEEFVASLTD